MNTLVITNYSRLKTSLFFFPVFLLVIIVFYLYSQDSLSVAKYIAIQKSSFYLINSKLSQFPGIEYNLTQFGDALICLSLLAVFFVFAPKLWEALIVSSIVSCLYSGILKKIFSIPRPAAVFDITSFVIIGKTLTGHNSLPSGHSITVFSTLTVLMFAFIPQKFWYKILWIFSIVMIGLILISTRVGVGAHYPIDVIVGGIIGYITGLTGIFITRKYKICNWINCKKYYPVFILLFLAFSISVFDKIIHQNLMIFYFTFFSLVFSLFKIVRIYVQK
ncbi:phosphatase PAP2 family protein [Sphingobacterium spiritivorum]|uniref:phosphatase PAP2 family protein n=1 Tax=Sphingobacterium spiritivorum TaxID=258 RepID=UPI003DA63872